MMPEANPTITPCRRHSISLLIVTLVLTWGFTGCDHLRSVLGNSHTEQFREWKRHHDNAKNLFLFVHGFNSDRVSAWGPFIELILQDSDYTSYNVLLYGYPQSACRQTHDIRDVGAHLKSFLVEELSKYDSIIFVAHSMGGLVTLPDLPPINQVG